MGIHHYLCLAIGILNLALDISMLDNDKVNILTNLYNTFKSKHATFKDSMINVPHLNGDNWVPFKR